MQHRYTTHNIIENTHAKILVSAIDRQVSLGDIDGVVLDHQCNLTYNSKHDKLYTIPHVALTTINGVVTTTIFL